MLQETEEMILLAEKKAKHRIKAAEMQAEEMLRAAEAEATRLLQNAEEKSRIHAANALLREDEYEKEEGEKQQAILNDKLQQMQIRAEQNQTEAVQKVIDMLQGPFARQRRVQK